MSVDKVIKTLRQGWKYSTCYKVYISGVIGVVLFAAWQLTSEPYVASRDVTEFLFTAPLGLVMGLVFISELIEHNAMVQYQIRKEEGRLDADELAREAFYEERNK